MTARTLWRNPTLARYCLSTLRFSGFATCTGPPSHCRPSAPDKASWRGHASTLVDGSSQFELSRNPPRLISRQQIGGRPPPRLDFLARLDFLVGVTPAPACYGHGR